MPRSAPPDPHAPTSGPARSGPGLAVTIAGPHAAAALAAWLLSPHRRRLAVVAAARQADAQPVIDVEGLAEQRGDRIDVYLIVGETVVAAVEELLPDGCGVPAGAVRLYPATAEWYHHPDAAPLLLARDRGEIDTLNSRLRAAIRSALRAASTEAAALAPRPSAVVAQLELEASGEPTAMASAEQGVALARHLLNPFREWPVMVITSHPGAGGPYLPAAAIALDVKGVAAVVELTVDATYGLADGLASQRLSACYGAARVYPLGRDWVQDTSLAPLRICPGPERAPAVAAQLVEDALVAARTAGALAQPALAGDAEPVTAVVQGPLGEHHVLVSVPAHGQATLLAARLSPGVPRDRLVSRGQQVRGRLTGSGPLPEFTPIPADDDPAARVRAAYGDGSICLARVEEVGPDAARVLLHPDVPAAMAREVDDPDLRDLLAVDDVVAVRVDWSRERPGAELADPAGGVPLLPSVSVLGQGPPWLVPADLDPERTPPGQPSLAPETAFMPRQAPVVDWTAAPSAAGTDHLRRRLQVAGDAADQYADELTRLQQRLDAAEGALAGMRVRLRKAHLASQAGLLQR